ncbi:type II secretion system protein GspL [Vibrio algarum]|uniref:Type II secretion system protein L n=1 Tax=Vibrio algarum TaxID=3020714 RepID=A0ABT4YLU7_9VIBR|nr:type II secretion system protein GspL [Vibrio sp. KJ40-1]MDB1122495.1 type II secretion system protein GspL [Vibrio sp. KJ40-1]
MSEFLTVRLSRDKQSPIRWLVWSTSQNEIIASGELSSKEQLSELSSYANQRVALLLLDSRDILLMKAEIPAGAARQVDTMLPYLLEDDIAQDVDELHFSILKKSDKEVEVVAVDNTYLSEWLQAFSEVGIAISKVIPDAETLPLNDNNISAVQIDSQWLFRKSQNQSISIDEQWLSLFLESNWCKEQDAKGSILSFTLIPDSLLNGTDWQQAEPELVMELLTKGAIRSSTNLLTGTFKPQPSILKYMKVWKNVVIAACLLLLIFTTQQVLQVNQYEAQATAYRTESERIFRTIFPNKNRIPTVSYLKRQMSDEENLLSHGDSETSVLAWLALIPDALKGKSSIEISNIRYDANRGEVRLEASMDDFQTFEVVRTKLAEKFAVTQGPLDKKANKVSGSFVLRQKQ